MTLVEKTAIGAMIMGLVSPVIYLYVKADQLLSDEAAIVEIARNCKNGYNESCYKLINIRDNESDRFIPNFALEFLECRQDKKAYDYCERLLNEEVTYTMYTAQFSYKHVF